MSTEQSFSYNGPFSTWAEQHSFGVALIAGLILGWSDTLLQDIQDEPHYAILGLPVGVWLGLKLRGE